MQMICHSEVLLYGGKPVAMVPPKPQVNQEAAHPDFHFPMYNPQTRKVEVPIVAERGTYYRDLAVLAARDPGCKRIVCHGKSHRLDWQVNRRRCQPGNPARPSAQA